MKYISTDAERIRLFRERNAVVKQLQEGKAFQNVWNAIVLFEGYPFHTLDNMKFRYSVYDMEIVSDKSKQSITKSTINVTVYISDSYCLAR